MQSMQHNVPLLTWTPVRRNVRARIYRTMENRWLVLIRDTVYDGAPASATAKRYVSSRDFEMLSDAEAFALAETGSKAKVSF